MSIHSKINTLSCREVVHGVPARLVTVSAKPRYKRFTERACTRCAANSACEPVYRFCRNDAHQPPSPTVRQPRSQDHRKGDGESERSEHEANARQGAQRNTIICRKSIVTERDDVLLLTFGCIDGWVGRQFL